MCYNQVVGGTLKKESEVVEIIRSPDAPHLVGKRGVISHKEGAGTCVKIGDTFTHFRKGDIKSVKAA